MTNLDVVSGLRIGCRTHGEWQVGALTADLMEAWRCSYRRVDERAARGACFHEEMDEISMNSICPRMGTC